MSQNSGIRKAFAALAGAAFLMASAADASAFTLGGDARAQVAAGSDIQQVWCNGYRCGPGWGWRHGRWGYWGPGAVIGGVVAGAIIAGAVANSYHGPCWRRFYDAWGRPYWGRVC